MDYCLADPTGNITLLVPAAPSQELAERLMRLEPSAEQIGFTGAGGDGYDISLSMAGGEFCGNATLSAAALYMSSHPELAGQECLLHVKASGALSPVPVTMRRTESEWRGSVEMPLPEWSGERDYVLGGQTLRLYTVVFSGITHVISEAVLDSSLAEAAAKSWCAALGAEALGIMQVNLSEMSLKPLVYVRSPETLFWESSCASGTAAAGVWLRDRFGRPGSWSFSEPAGSLEITADSGGRLLLTGSVKLQKKKTAV